MDRYVIRETRTNPEHLMGNQMIAFSPTSTGGNNITMYNQTSSEIPCMGGNFVQPQQNMISMSNALRNNPNQHSGHIVSGIDTRYLAAFVDNNATYIAAGISGKHIHLEPNSTPITATFGNDYQNRSFVGAQKFDNKAYLHRPSGGSGLSYPEVAQYQQPAPRKVYDATSHNRSTFQNKSNLVTPKKPQSSTTATIEIMSKSESQVQSKSRSELQKELYQSGPRAFSGTVENVMKWHKSLQDIGILIFYEIVAKCVNVRPGESCAKNLVVRDENGPAMQIVYYEIDFLMPEIKPPCTIRVIGRMIAGTNRLQAYNVRLATGDDVATLPRRAAVAAHHVAKLCKEYGNKI